MRCNGNGLVEMGAEPLMDYVREEVSARLAEIPR